MFARLLIAIFGLCFSFVAVAQNMTISTSASSGSYTITGTNPITIAATGTTNISTSVIQGYLNAGTAVILTAVSSANANISLQSSITSTGSGRLTLKANGNVEVNSSVSIQTNGGDIVLWANNDNANSDGYVALRNSSSIVTGSNGVTGGKVWIGGGSDGGTWNGISVGVGYAVPGANFSPPSGGPHAAGVYLEGCSISTFGGNVKILGNVASAGRAITTYGSISIDSKAGGIEIEGNATNSAITNAYGVLFGIHDISIASVVNLSSSASGTAITIRGFSRGSEDAIGLSGTLNAQSTGTGGILFQGTPYGTGPGINIGNYYHGKLNAYAASGDITFNGGSKGVYVSTAVTGGITTGPSKLNIGQGGSISSSSSNVILTGDVISSGANGIAILSTGNVTIQPSGTSFTSALSFLSPAFSVPSTVSGLTIGKVGNTADVALNVVQNVAGPISIYAGNLEVNQNLSSTLVGATILLQATNTFSLATTTNIQSNAGNIILRSNASGVANVDASSIILNSGSSLLSQGGHITLGGNFTGVQGTGLYATSSNAPSILINTSTISAAGGNIKLYGKHTGTTNDGIRLTGTINTMGSGTIELYGEANGGLGSSTTYYGGITFGSSVGSTIQTVNGDITLSGLLTASSSNSTAAINFFRNASGTSSHINILSNTGDIEITGSRGSTSAWCIGHASSGHVYFGSPSSGWTASGNITFNFESEEDLEEK